MKKLKIYRERKENFKREHRLLQKEENGMTLMWDRTGVQSKQHFFIFLIHKTTQVFLLAGQ